MDKITKQKIADIKNEFWLRQEIKRKLQPFLAKYPNTFMGPYGNVTYHMTKSDRLSDIDFIWEEFCEALSLSDTKVSDAGYSLDFSGKYNAKYTPVRVGFFCYKHSSMCKRVEKEVTTLEVVYDCKYTE